MPAVRTVKPKPQTKRSTRSRAAKNVTIDPEDQSDEDGETGSQDDEPIETAETYASELAKCEKKAKELKKPAATQNYTAAFAQKVKTQEDGVINTLNCQRSENVSKSTSFTKAFCDLVDEMACTDSKLLPQCLNPVNAFALASKHPLYIYQTSLMSLATGLLTAHKPFQTTLNSVIDNDLLIGRTWTHDGDEAIRVLREIHQEANHNLVNILKGETATGISEDSWGQSAKKAGKGIKRALLKVPLPPAELVS